MRDYLMLIIAAVSVFLTGPAATAHEQAVAFTEITPRAAQSQQAACVLGVCRMEIAHRFSIHDAESALLSVLGERPDLGFNPQAQAKFEAYVAERFQLIDGETDAVIPLTPIGGEVERGFYWVYQEAFAPKAMRELKITSGAMMDVIPTQTNRVNVYIDGEVRTLVFARDPGPQSVSLR